jgi:hypothetical protein
MILFLYTATLITAKAVIPEKTGIQKNTGFPRIKYGAGLVEPGMTNRIRLMSSCIILLFFSFLSVSIASDLNAVRTPSTGYQPQFHMAGNGIYYVWHEDHGPTEPIWSAIETLSE